MRHVTVWLTESQFKSELQGCVGGTGFHIKRYNSLFQAPQNGRIVFRFGKWMLMRLFCSFLLKLM